VLSEIFELIFLAFLLTALHTAVIGTSCPCISSILNQATVIYIYI